MDPPALQVFGFRTVPGQPQQPIVHQRDLSAVETEDVGRVANFSRAITRSSRDYNPRPAWRDIRNPQLAAIENDRGSIRQ
jgi:hypothetical protein